MNVILSGRTGWMGCLIECGIVANLQLFDVGAKAMVRSFSEWLQEY
jgi:hypothetical protein